MTRCFGKPLFQAVRANLVTDGVQSREEERGGRGGGGMLINIMATRGCAS
jgi:hypothetical protein